jgi:iron complex outermembrane receptor protein
MSLSNRRVAPNRHARAFHLAQLALAVALSAGSAGTRADGPAPDAAPVRTIDPIVVTGTRVERSSFNLPMSIDAVVAPDIQDGQPRVNLSEVLTRVPGLVIQNRQNYAQDLQVSSRGFGTRSTFGIRGLRIIVDDIPSTNPDGQGQAANINLGSAKRIEVLRGPFSAIYGNASGGVIQAFTEDGPPTPTLSAALLAGSYQTGRGEVKFGDTVGPINYIGDLSRFETKGYRDHSAATRDQGGAKFIWQTDPNGKLTIIANQLRQIDTEDPLGLTRAQVDANPRQVDPAALMFNTRKSIENTQGGMVYERKISNENTFKLIGYTGTRQVVQFLSTPVGAQTPPTSSGGVVDLDREFYGLGLRWTYSGGGPQPLTLTAGIDYDNSKERRKGYNNFIGTTTGIRGALRRDEDDTVYNVDEYVQAEWQFAEAWSLSAGVRNSQVKFKSEDFFITATNPNDSGDISYHHVNPVAGLLFKATPSLNLYVNTGRGFETPSFAELAYKPNGTTGLNFALQPSESRNVEGGVKWKVRDGTRVNFAIFETRVTNEIVPATNSGGRTTFQNASKTKRQGAELSLDTYITDDITAYLAYSYLDATFEQAFTYRPTAAPTTVTVAAGNQLPGVPRTTTYGELAWRRGQQGLSAALEIIYHDRIFANDVNSEAAGRYTIANARLGYAHRADRWQLMEFLRVDNLSSRKYIGSVIVNEANGRFYEPSPERGVMVGVNATYPF